MRCYLHYIYCQWIRDRGCKRFINTSQKLTDRFSQTVLFCLSWQNQWITCSHFTIILYILLPKTRFCLVQHLNYVCNRYDCQVNKCYKKRRARYHNCVCWNNNPPVLGHKGQKLPIVSSECTAILAKTTKFQLWKASPFAQSVHSFQLATYIHLYS